MIHPNVGFKDAILTESSGGTFRLHDAATREPLSPIEFSNRKAARNWAHGRGLRVIESTATALPPAFPRPLG